MLPKKHTPSVDVFSDRRAPQAEKQRKEHSKTAAPSTAADEKNVRSSSRRTGGKIETNRTPTTRQGAVDSSTDGPSGEATDCGRKRRETMSTLPDSFPRSDVRRSTPSYKPTSKLKKALYSTSEKPGTLKSKKNGYTTKSWMVWLAFAPLVLTLTLTWLAIWFGYFTRIVALPRIASNAVTAITTHPHESLQMPTHPFAADVEVHQTSQTWDILLKANNSVNSFMTDFSVLEETELVLYKAVMHDRTQQFYHQWSFVQSAIITTMLPPDRTLLEAEYDDMLKPICALTVPCGRLCDRYGICYWEDTPPTTPKSYSAFVQALCPSSGSQFTHQYLAHRNWLLHLFTTDAQLSDMRQLWAPILLNQRSPSKAMVGWSNSLDHVANAVQSLKQRVLHCWELLGYDLTTDGLLLTNQPETPETVIMSFVWANSQKLQGSEHFMAEFCNELVGQEEKVINALRLARVEYGLEERCKRLI